MSSLFPFFFFFNDTATTEIYTLSLHDALPICRPRAAHPRGPGSRHPRPTCPADRKSTRLNSSHTVISYAVFCLKKKKKERAEDGESERAEQNGQRDRQHEALDDPAAERAEHAE